jgi:hypothetical protein
MDIIEAEATTNKNDMEHNKKYQSELENQKSNKGIFSQAIGIFGFGNLPQINKEIEELQSKQAKHKHHEQELREQIRAQIEIQEEIMRSKNDINQMFRDSGNDNTDGNRVSTINFNYIEICRFIESHIKNFKFRVSSDYALMHALANEIQRQYLEKNNKEFNFYENPIDFNMLKDAFTEMPIFQNGDTVETFLESAQKREEAKKREKIASSQQHNKRFAKLLSSRLPLSLVPPEEYEANSQKYKAIDSKKKKRKKEKR